MAVRSGEDTAAVLFADVHYHYNSPNIKPAHHRFDKASYVYLFEHAGQRRARIEIANNAGTPEQDAFTGYLDGSHIQYSYKHSTLVTLTVDGPAEAQDWHLPTYDLRNENKYMYKLHTVDLYFWSKEEAIQFLNGVRRVLPQQQVSVQDEPIHQGAISAVVRNLENVAITDPSYQHGQTKDSRTTAPPQPPISATPQSQELSFVPMAYNPAAPPAPETIVHREKTPPPEDGNTNPLLAAASFDHYAAQQIPGLPGHYFTSPPPPPASAPAASSHSRPPVQPATQSPFAQHFQHSFAPPPTAPISSPPAPTTSIAPPQSPTYQQQTSNMPVTQFANYPTSPGITRAMTTPGLYSPGISSPAATPSIYQPGLPQAPPGGFAQYTYESTVSHTQPQQTDYSIHQQVYRPTESEATPKPGKVPRPARGKLEERAGQLERGVGSLFKKLEKRIG